MVPEAGSGTDERCDFCAIIAGELPREIHYEDDEFVVFKNNPGEALVVWSVVPRRHMGQMEFWMSPLFEQGARLAVAVGEQDAPKGFRIDSDFDGDAIQSQSHGHLYVLDRQTRQTDSRLGAIDPAMRKEMTFASFVPEGRGLTGYPRETLRTAYKAAQSFAEQPSSWLVLVGETGCGKTHLAVAVANVQLERGREVFYTLVPDLLDDLRATYSADSRVTYGELFDRVKQAPFLILDDFGGEQSTPWAQEKLYQIIVHRHHARLPTIITTRDIPSRENDPINSRLRDPRVVTICGIEAPDYRKFGNWQEGGSQQKGGSQSWGRFF